MADLLVASISLAVLRDTWTRKPSLYQGGRARMRDNSFVSTETAEKMVYECRVDLLDATDEAAFRAAVPRGVGVAIDGDLPGTAFTGTVDIGDTQVLLVTIDGVDSLLRTTTLHIEES